MVQLMPLKVIRFNLWFHYEGPARQVVIDYVPIALDGDQERELVTYETQMRISPQDLPEVLQRKLARLADYLQTLMPAPEVEVEGVPLRGTPVFWLLQSASRTQSGPRLPRDAA